MYSKSHSLMKQDIDPPLIDICCCGHCTADICRVGLIFRQPPSGVLPPQVLLLHLLCVVQIFVYYPEIREFGSF